MIGNEVQASKAEGLEGHKDRRFLQPKALGSGKLQRAKADRTVQAHEVGDAGDGGHPIARTYDVLPTYGAKLSIPKMAGS
jgi:hypothetical protein